MIQKEKSLMRLKTVVTPSRVVFFLLLSLMLLPLTVGADGLSTWAIPKGSLGWGNGGNTISNQAEATAFYQHFSVYLQPHWGIVAKGFALVGGFMVKGLGNLIELLQQIFYVSVKFMTILNDLGKNGTTLGNLYGSMQKLGVIIFGLSIVVYAIFVIFNGKSKIFRNVLQTVFLATLVFSFIPWMVGQVLHTTQDAVHETAQASGEKSLALNLIQNNVVDKYALNALNWKVPLQADGTVKNPAQYNVITSVNGWDPSELAGVATDQVLGTMGDSKGLTQGNATQAQIIFEHQLANKTIATGSKLKGNQEVQGIDKGTINLSAYFANNYLRYKVNWLPLFIALIALGFLLITMTIKVGLSTFQIIATTISAPVLAAIKASHTKKVKELIANIFHGIVGIYFDFLIMAIAVGVMNWLSATDVFFKAGLPSLGVSLLKAMLYVVIFSGVFAGIGVVEHFLGVSSGHGNALKQVMAGSMIARAAFSGGSFGWRAMTSVPGRIKGNWDNAMAGREQTLDRQLQLLPQGGNDTSSAQESRANNALKHSGLNSASPSLSQKTNPTGEQGEHQRQKAAQETLSKGQNRPEQFKEKLKENKQPTQEPTPKPTQEVVQEKPQVKAPLSQVEQPFEPIGELNSNPIETEKTRREKAKERLQQRGKVQGEARLNMPGAEAVKEELMQQAPQSTEGFETPVPKETISPTDLRRIEELETRMNQADKQKRQNVKQQKLQAHKQKQSARLQKASQNLEQAGQILQQVEPHLRDVEGEE
ncbi:pLS20_p028 family conjugation system transmembrane protein [Lactococcus taiwanensis]|uniref:pLS20_p028 family conjugation system transmembrane protein n=1 Tax=Lactococcus taiwanensis TaxID=1151742 RepID=UPI0035144ADB